MTAMRTIKDRPSYSRNLPGIRRHTTAWADGPLGSGHGYQGVQIRPGNARLFHLAKAAGKPNHYCDEVKGVLHDAGVELTELSTHLQGQLSLFHPAYDLAFDGFAAPE